jgi:type I restriction enzyme, S subunit
MKDWKIVKIGDLLKNRKISLQTGPFGTQLKASEYVKQGIPVINVRNIGFRVIREDNLEYVNEKKGLQLKSHFILQNDIVFGRKGAVERHLFVKKAQEKWIQGSDCLRLRFLTKEIDPAFVSYYFLTKGHQDWMNALCSFGATMTSLNQEIIGKIHLNLPPLATQKKIADILTAYDDLIEINERRIRLLEQTARQVYREWFVRGRFPGWEGVERVLGLAEGWEVRKIGEVLDFYIGGGWGNEKADNEFSETGFVIRGTDMPGIRKGIVNKAILRFHKKSNIKSRILKHGDIVFEVSGGSEGQPLGRTVLITDPIIESFGDNVICASFCKLMRTEKISFHYFYQFLNHLYDSGTIETYQIQSTGISNYQFEPFLKNQEIIIPTKKLLDDFHQFSEKAFHEIAILGRQNTRLRATRDSLLPRLLSGQMEV